MYKALLRTCLAIVSLIKPFVRCCSSCRCRRGLRKAPCSISGGLKKQGREKTGKELTDVVVQLTLVQDARVDIFTKPV